MKYTIKNPDYELSPYSGMTREHWIDVCYFLLEGVFSHIKDFNDPIVFPRYDTEVSYPRPNDPEWRHGSERFEGLARTLLVAAPLMKNHPDAVVNGYKLRDYYSNQILLSIDPATKSYFGRLKDILKAPGRQIAFQHTCECASLVIALMVTKEHIWDRYSQDEKDRIADFLSEFGHYRTHAHNWRFFNLLILSFLKVNGYKIDEEIMKDHVMNALTYYVGDGWYRDGNLFDYYSPWAFQFYGPLWNVWYGYEYEPELASVIEKNSNELMTSYPRFFDKDSKMIMWGRSNIYRSAASAPLGANLLLRNDTINPGLARRIISGNILQFITKEELFINDVPCLGFYGPFQPLLQNYSCASSSFWFANSFMCLTFDEDSPFWTEKETNGIWDEIGDESKTMVLDGPALSITNHGKTGTTEIKTAKVLMKKGHPWIADYSRLSFNSEFPWEEIDKTGPVSMNYSLKYGQNSEQYSVPNLIMYGGEEDGVLYRRIYFDFVDTFKDNPAIDLADIPISNGIIRIDRVRISEKPYELLLGHYGLPHIDGICDIEEKTINDNQVVIGKTKGLQLAFIPYRGWDEISYKHNNNKNAMTEKSTLIYSTSRRDKMYSGIYLLITVMLHKTDNDNWTKEELSPIEKVEYCDVSKRGGCGAVNLLLKDGREILVDFNKIEGRLSI